MASKFFRGPLFRRAVALSAAASATSTVCIHLDGGAPDAWAHPSPYDPEIPTRRFAPVNHLRGPPRSEWDLPGLLAAWRASPSEETWPWVWTQPNSSGPHHVFLGFGPGTLAHIALAAQADARNNLTVVLPEASEEGGDVLTQHGTTEAQLFGLGCAIIRARVAQLDTKSKLLMLSDERILAFDYAHLA